MQCCVQWFPRLVSGFFLALLLGCPQSPVQGERIETTVSGRAPLNGGGEIRILGGNPLRQLAAVKADDAGRFSAKLAVVQGPLHLEAWGGSYREAATGATAHVDGLRLRAITDDLTPGGHSKASITPWTELAAAVADSDVGVYRRVLKDLASALSCDGAYADALTVEPANVQEPSIQTLNGASLAYLYQGGLSQLAKELSDEARVQPGARITTMSLVRLLADDLSDGHVDGRRFGSPLEVANGFYLPEDALRQRLAQAVRRFADDAKANKSSLRSEAIIDILKCVSANENPLLGPKGTPLDVNGPQLTLHAPPEKAVVFGDAGVHCEATDESEIFSLELEASQHQAILKNALSRHDLFHAPGGAILKAQLSTNTLQDGSLTLTCLGIDRWKNETRLSVVLAVNNAGGAVSASVSPMDAERVKGRVRIECTCQDAHLESCGVGEPYLAGLALVSKDSTKAVYDWDTTQVMDGPQNIVCNDYSMGHVEPAQAYVPVVVDNIPPGSIHGTVMLDAPVHNVEVVAYAYTEGKKGRVLGEGEAESGTFHLALADNYRGPILLEATPSKRIEAQAYYDSAVTDEVMTFGPEPLQMLWKHYEPGEPLPGVSINALTTLAASYASAVHSVQPDWLEDKSVEGAITVSSLLWSRHVRPDHPFDLPKTHPTSFLSQEGSRQGTDLDAQFLGLFHVGLSRLAMEYSLREYGSVHGLSVGKVLQILAQDMQDLSLDGRRSGEALYLTRQQGLSDMFLRFELAAAIRNWLRSQALANDKPARLNTTPFDARELSRPGRFLRNLAIDRSKIFGEQGGREFDMDGPEIEVRFEDGMRRVIEPASGHRGWIYIYVTATDDSKVVSVKARLGKDPLRSRGPVNNGYAEYAFNTEEYPDDEYDLVLEAADEYGNDSDPAIRKIRIDNTAPRISFPGSNTGEASLWMGGQGTLHLRGRLDKPCESLRLAGPGIPEGVLLERAPAGDFDLPAELRCNATYHATVEATDYAGNIGRVPIHIYCDAMPPAIEATGVGFTQERSGIVVYPDQKAWESSTPAFEKHYNKLDYLPPELNKNAGNLPAARFKVSDPSDSLSGLPGAEAKDLKVEYRYVYEGHLGTYVRDWELLSDLASPASPSDGMHGRLSDNEYQVVLSYQTLLPRPILEAGVQHARANNFLARSKQDDRHRVEVRVTDLAGNVSTPQVFEFRLDLFSPDVTVSECSIPAEARSVSVAGMTLPTIYSGHVPLMDTTISWGLDRPNGSLAPDGRILVEAKTTGFESRIKALDVERTKDGPDYGYEQRMDSKRCPHQWNHRIVFESGYCEHAGTNEHKYPRSWVDPLTVTSQQAATFEFSGSPQTSNGAIYLAGGDRVGLRMRVSGHLNTFNRTPYTWPVHGRKYFIWSERGAEIHSEPPFRHKFVPFTQTSTLRRLEVARRPVNIVFAGTEGGIPGPKNIVHGSSCATSVTLVWDMAEGFHQ